MRPILITALVAAVVLNGAAAHAEDSDVQCGLAIAAGGTATRIEGSADFERYHGKVPAGLAKNRAINKWQAVVAANCPGSSAFWWRAKDKSVDCDAGMGKDTCTATAVPRRKFLSWFLPQ